MESERTLIKRALEKAGFACRTASSGEEAIAMVTKNPSLCDVISLDNDMGKGQLTGIETLKKLRKRLGAMCPPIVFLTRQNEIKLAIAALREGAYHFVIKDDDSKYQETLHADMQEAIRKNSANLYDVTTGFYKREHFIMLFNLAVRAGKVGSKIVIMHIVIGDSATGLAHEKLGLTYQSKIMKIASCRLRKATKAFNCKIARTGSYEMMVIFSLTGDDEKEIFVAAGKIAKLFKQDFVISGKSYAMDSTIGTAVCPIHGRDVTSLLGATAFTQLSTNIPSHEFEKYYREACESIELKNYLLEIMGGDGHELITYFQAQVNKDGEVVGLEALVRLGGKDGEMVSPTKFIPIAQKYQNIISWIDKTVREQACQALKELKQDGFVLKVSTNITFQELEGPTGGSLKEGLKALLDKCGLSSSNFNLEITEDAAMHGKEATIAIMRGLKEAGILISIDDFGTGYANFAYLKRLPVYAIKIPRELIQDIATEESSLAVLKTIIFLANELKLNVVAEGVETVEQEELLFKLCPNILIQGYYRSEPLPLDKLKKFLSVVLECKGLPWCFKNIEPFLK
jgi:EAL domain-containing protein (putative c-di-GMP-specific phosphodiesterase class I)/DNA-binding response OmpR family regulator